MSRPSRTTPAALLLRLMHDDFALFMSQLRDVGGGPLTVAAHHAEWCRLIVKHPRLVLLAPRDHGKSTIGLAYVLWQCFRHATAAAGASGAAGLKPFSAVLFSATLDQAAILMDRFRTLVGSNEWLFASAKLATPGGVRAAQTHVRLPGGAELRTRAYGTSTRGLHPDLLVLDDVLNDQNSGSDHQREQTWRYFLGTLLPMHPRQALVVGTAFHAADLLHRLGPASVGGGSGPHVGGLLDFAWRRFRALDDDTETTLWPARHPYAELARIRDADPTIFSREYQNDPRDDRSSLFPYSLTQPALDAGSNLSMPAWYRADVGEIVVLGADLARSERVGADYTVAIVVAYEIGTGRRRVLAARRERGLDFDGQIAMFAGLARDYGVSVGFIEQNGFQGWLVDELRRRPGGHVFFGHTTGRTRATLDSGIPMLSLALHDQRWVMPTGDAASARFARIWQAELAAFGWRDGRLEGVGEHDDTVIASWYVELAIQTVTRSAGVDDYEIVTLEDLGIERVRIGSDY